MADNATNDGASTVASGSAAKRIFIFKSEAKPDLGAFAADPVGLELPAQFKPWHAVGAIAPDRDPPYKLSRAVIETAINAKGFQLFRLKEKD